MELSKIWEKLSKVTGVRKIMNDIQKTLAEAQGDIINMSAWNPVILPELENFWKQQTQEFLESEEFWEVIGRYGSTKWYEPFLEAMVDFSNTHFFAADWKKWTKDNLLVTTWSQSFYFFAINAFAWTLENWIKKKVLLPQSPEYTWYGWMWLEEDIFFPVEPSYELNRESKRYHYTVNTKNFPEDKKEVWLIIISRPSNPTGNVISVEELQAIYSYVEGTDIPVLLDSAYAPPIPNLAYDKFEMLLHPNTIVCLSFSKAWLPWERVWIVLGAEKFLDPIEAFESNTCIMSSRFWQAILSSAIQSWELEHLSKSVINVYYKKKFEILQQWLSQYVQNDVPYFLHETKGAMFGFMYFENLPITDEELYQKLKKKWVLFVPGNSFFIWVDKKNYKHANQCMRISITVSDNEILKACKVLWEVLDELY